MGKAHPSWRTENKFKTLLDKLCVPSVRLPQHKRALRAGEAQPEAQTAQKRGGSGARRCPSSRALGRGRRPARLRAGEKLRSPQLAQSPGLVDGAPSITTARPPQLPCRAPPQPVPPRQSPPPGGGQRHPLVACGLRRRLSPLRGAPGLGTRPLSARNLKRSSVGTGGQVGEAPRGSGLLSPPPRSPHAQAGPRMERSSLGERRALAWLSKFRKEKTLPCP